MQRLEAQAVTRMDFKEWIRWHAAGHHMCASAVPDSSNIDHGDTLPSYPGSRDVQRSTGEPTSAAAASVRSSSSADTAPASEVRCERTMHGDCR